MVARHYWAGFSKKRETIRIRSPSALEFRKIGEVWSETGMLVRTGRCDGLRHQNFGFT